jgi:hypothetical protein
LDAEPEGFREISTKRVQFNEQVAVATLEETPSETGEVEIDEPKIDRLLHILHEADPTGERVDPDDLKILEGMTRPSNFFEGPRYSSLALVFFKLRVLNDNPSIVS